MESPPQNAATSKTMFWAGWVFSILPALMLVMSGTMKILGPPDLAKGFAELGWPVNLALALGIVELGSTLLYLIPQTAVLGAILLTGYLGGATATHARIGQWAFVAPVLLGMVIWLGLFLRDARIRQLIPLRR
jgi:uncharacterized membrane protein YphA (DoxX/SURF4 family)